MVKFSKQLDGQLVPEWRAAYCNYKLLKKNLNRLRTAIPRRPSDSPLISLTGLRRRSAVPLSKKESIAVRNRGDADSEENFETEFVDETSSDENMTAFFRTLDIEFNKVNRFYGSKEDEYLQRAELLDKQMSTLLHLQNLLQEQKVSFVDNPERNDELNEEGAQLVISNSLPEQEESSSDPPVTLDSLPEEKSVGKIIFSDLPVRNDSLVKERDHMRTVKDKIDEPQENVKSSFERRASNDELCGMVSSQLVCSGSTSVLPKDALLTSGEEEIPHVLGGFERLSLVPSDMPVDLLEPKQQQTQERKESLEDAMKREDHEDKGQIKININMPATTPVATISALSQILWEDILQQMRRSTSDNRQRNDVFLSKKKVLYAEKMLRKALVEYYRGLGLLKSYSTLNMVAFAKILKKFDKVMEKDFSSPYLRAVESSYFCRSDKVVRLMEKVEKLFTKHFQNNNRRKAMAVLRPMQHKATHRVTFVLGLFTGASLALIGVMAIIAPVVLWQYRAVNGKNSGEDAYMETVFPLFSMFGLILLHMYMYGCDIYLWRRTHINYAFIFEFIPGSELRHRQMLMLCTSLTAVYLGVMVGHLAAHNPRHQISEYVDFIPATMLLVFLGLLFCPFNLCYRDSRLFFLRSLLHLVCAPLYKVVLADFFLGDQLTSQVPSFRQLEYVLCYYFGGHFKHGDSGACTKNGHFKRIAYVVSLLPYWWRLAQCARRYVDEGDKLHICNMAKYLSAMLAVGVKVTYGKSTSKALLVVTVITSIIATLSQLYWDIVVDWGLLRRNSKNPWLRDELILHDYKYVYYVCMVLNLIFRLAWLQSVARFQLGKLDYHMTEFIFAGLEIIRRGIWNFFRIENEHLNNIGKFRAVKTVPLPFEELHTDF